MFYLRTIFLVKCTATLISLQNYNDNTNLVPLSLRHRARAHATNSLLEQLELYPATTLLLGLHHGYGCIRSYLPTHAYAAYACALPALGSLPAQPAHYARA